MSKEYNYGLMWLVNGEYLFSSKKKAFAFISERMNGQELTVTDRGGYLSVGGVKGDTLGMRVTRIKVNDPDILYQKKS